MRLFVVQDGIKNVGSVLKNGEQIMNTNFHLITYDFKTNEGYIDKKKPNIWKLYTQVGQKIGKKRDYYFLEFIDCIMKLEELKGNNEITIYKSRDIENYK